MKKPSTNCRMLFRRVHWAVAPQIQTIDSDSPRSSRLNPENLGSIMTFPHYATRWRIGVQDVKRDFGGLYSRKPEI